MSGLYLCDPRKNAHCRGTLCFYRDEALWHWCMATDDPACAITGPEGEPLAICPEALDGMILRDKLEPHGLLYERGREHAQTADDGGAAGDL